MSTQVRDVFGPTGGVMVLPVEDLREGYMVDLYFDPFADPDDPSTEFEYLVVESVEQETPECTAVVFGHTWIGFPHGHQVRVRSE